MTAGRPKRWRRDEDEILYRCYPTGGAEAVHTALPHRSRNAIRVHAQTLHVRFNRAIGCAVFYEAAQRLKTGTPANVDYYRRVLAGEPPYLAVHTAGAGL